MFENSATGEKLQSNVQTLKRLIHSPLKDDFILELRRLTNPEHILKDFVEQLRVIVAFILP